MLDQPVKIRVSVALLALAPLFPVQAQDLGQVWQARAFGQSVDFNFETNVLPAKVGVNHVWLGQSERPMAANETGSLAKTFTLESRGGKIANTHDGLIFYYTRLATDKNFVLEADLTVEQFGPETAATPNGQESAGLMLRDTIGTARQEPLVLGYEEFPAASNMVANALLTQNKKKDGALNVQFVYRDGVRYPYGNQGAIIPKATYAEINYSDPAKSNYRPSLKMRLERTDAGFVTSLANADGSQPVQHSVKRAHANIVQSIEPGFMYVGFFAARNARVRFDNTKLSLSAAKTVAATPYQAVENSTNFEILSPATSVGTNYIVQARSDYDGQLVLLRQGQLLQEVMLSAGDFFSLPSTLAGTQTDFEFHFTPSAGPDVGKTLKNNLLVQAVSSIKDAKNIYVAPHGQASNDGSQAAPLDLATALQLLAPGGTVHVLDGVYPRAITLPVAVSGVAQQLKTLRAVNPGAVVFKGHKFSLDASYWHLKDIVVTGSPDRTVGMQVSGSFNTMENVTTHHNGNTGLLISTREKLGPALWPRHNLVLNSESHHNQDSPMKDADGFAAKLGVGVGNIFRGCISHHNVDDGWDLFNKIEDGPNGPVQIENSIAYENGSNGFKLGGEAQMVENSLQGSLAFHNKLDGITDNFNPGALRVAGNISFDNQRFNYIFRTNPYGIEPQSVLTNNISLRTNYAEKHDDAVVGKIDPASNYFIRQGVSQNQAGQRLLLTDFVTAQPPAVFQRAADGSIERAGFLQKAY